MNLTSELSYDRNNNSPLELGEKYFTGENSDDEQLKDDLSGSLHPLFSERTLAGPETEFYIKKENTERKKTWGKNPFFSPNNHSVLGPEVGLGNLQSALFDQQGKALSIKGAVEAH